MIVIFRKKAANLGFDNSGLNQSKPGFFEGLPRVSFIRETNHNLSITPQRSKSETIKNKLRPPEDGFFDFTVVRGIKNREVLQYSFAQAHDDLSASPSFIFVGTHTGTQQQIDLARSGASGEELSSGRTADRATEKAIMSFFPTLAQN